MSPEQLMSAKDVDGRTDIWALGVVLYEMLTGQVPFSGDTLPQLCTAVLNAVPVRPSVHRPDLPPELEAVILRCLDKDRDKRFGTASELSRALAPFAGDVSASVPPAAAHTSTPPPAVAAQSAPGTASAPGIKSVPDVGGAPLRSVPPGAMTQQSLSSSAAVPPPKKSPLGAILGGAAVLAVVGAGVYFAVRPAPPVPAPPAPAAAPVPVTAAPAPTPADTTPTVVPSAPAPETATPTPTAAPTATASAEAPAGVAKLPAGKRGAPVATAKPAAPVADPFGGARR
jgi:serine/threonine-protein kinase